MNYQVGDLLKLKYNNIDIYDRNGNVATHQVGEYYIVLSETPTDDSDADFVIVSQKTQSRSEWYGHNLDHDFEKV